MHWGNFNLTFLRVGNQPLAKFSTFLKAALTFLPRWVRQQKGFVAKTTPYKALHAALPSAAISGQTLWGCLENYKPKLASLLLHISFTEIPLRYPFLSTTLFHFFKKFIYLWLCWIFVSVRGLSLVVAGGGHSSSRCAGLSLSRPLLLRSTGSRRAGSQPLYFCCQSLQLQTLSSLKGNMGFPGK